MADSTNSTQPALLFMPDISGFTQFMKEVDASHSQHIIEELLETIVESNQMGLKISEIEGDAIFFYKLGPIPTPEEIAEQCKKMFIAFHEQLRRYDMSKICDCGACTAASSLTLKIVAHKGEVSFYKVREYEKLFGSDVILVHRLLKNDVPEHEYMLATEGIPLHQLDSSGKNNYSWIQLTKGKTTYDLGDVNYSYSTLNTLHDLVQDPPKPEVKLYHVKNPLRFETEINAPIGVVYDALIDLPQRMNYIPGIKELKVHDKEHNTINRIGTRHECIRDANSIDVITSNVERSKGMVSFSETAADQPMTTDYVLEKMDGKMKLSMLIHLELNFMKRIMFNLFIKKKLTGSITQTMENLKIYCEGKSLSQQPF